MPHLRHETAGLQQADEGLGNCSGALLHEESVAPMVDNLSHSRNVAPDDWLAETPRFRKHAAKALLGGWHAKDVARSQRVGLLLEINFVHLQYPAVGRRGKPAARVGRARTNEIGRAHV